MMAVLAGKLAARRADCAPVAGKSTLNRLELSKLEQFVNRKVALEHEVAAILDLRMICGLSRSAAACSAATSSMAKKALSFLRKPDLGTVEFLRDEAVAVDVIGSGTARTRPPASPWGRERHRGCRSSNV
jgi:hypothetical protein